MMTEEEELEGRRAAVRVGVFAGIAHRRVIRQRRAIALVAGAGLLLAAGAAVGAAKVVTASQQDIDTFAECYKTPDLSLSPNGAQWGGPGTIDISENCQIMWDGGGDDVGHRPPGVPDDAVPEIAACLGPAGVGAGFPIWNHSETEEELCTRLGLPVFDDSLQTP
jgi:hypothetical protein